MKRTSLLVEKTAIELYLASIPIAQITAQLALNEATLYRILDRQEVKKRKPWKKYTRKIAAIICKKCSKISTGEPGHMKNRQFCSKTCADAFKTGKKLIDFFGEEKAKRVTETARERSKNNPNLKKFTKGFVPWNKDWGKGSYFSKASTENIRKGQLKVAAMRKGKSLEDWVGPEKAAQLRKHRSKLMAGWIASGKFQARSNTRIERLMKQGLISQGYEEGRDFIPQFCVNDKFVCDFAFPKERVIIECDGDYWHANPSIYNESKLYVSQKRTVNMDRSKYAYLEKMDGGSWLILRFWENQIINHLAECVARIESAILRRRS